MNELNWPKLNPETGYEEQDIRDFDKKVKASSGDHVPIEYIVGPIIGGIGVELVYKKGGLSRASTVSKGMRGYYVTANIKTLLTVPLDLVQLDEGCDIPDLLAIRCDVYMELEAFNAFNNKRIKQDLHPFSNPVDAAADSLHQPNPRITAKRPLNMFCSGILEYDGPSFETRMESLVMLQKWGLRVNKPLFRECPTIDKAIQHCRHLEDHRARFPFAIDGAVIELNRMSHQARLVDENGNLGWNCSLKFKS